MKMDKSTIQNSRTNLLVESYFLWAVAVINKISIL